jgi:hypothetical protein
MRTRTKGVTKTASDEVKVAKSTSAKVQLGPDSANPPRIFVLPEDITAEARIISLTNPRYVSKDRYIVCPERGFYEFKVVSAPKTTPRSWLLSHQKDEVLSEADNPADLNLSRGYVTRTADLYVATPIDPLFFLLPVLSPATKTVDPPKRLFLSSDDYFERVTSASPHLGSFIRRDEVLCLLEKRMQAVCETVEAGDETMYRLDEEMLLREVLEKAKKMAQRGLPASMEEKLVRKALEVPMLSITRDESSLQDLEDRDALPTSLSETPDTQTTVSSTDSAASSFSQASTAATSFSEESANTAVVQNSKSTSPKIIAPDGVADLLRLRVAFDFLCSNYITPHVAESLNKTLNATTSVVDFGPLNTHLAHLTKLRQEAAASRSLGDYSRKRSVQDDEDVEIRAEKKRKMEEEEKRKKAGESLGVKRLKKVNISGMKKMSEFFKKK